MILGLALLFVAFVVIPTVMIAVFMYRWAAR